MSFPLCMFHPVEWVSHTQTAPGVSSLSTTDGTESCLSPSELDLVWSRGALAKPQKILWTPQMKTVWQWMQKCLTQMRGSLQDCNKSTKETQFSSEKQMWAQGVSTQAGPLCVDMDVKMRQRTKGDLPLIEWTSGSPVVSQSLLQARWSSADCSLPPAAMTHTLPRHQYYR